MEVALLAVRFVEIVALLPGFALQIIAVMVINRVKMLGTFLKSFLILLIVANLWFCVSNFICALVTTLEGINLRFGFELQDNSTLREYADYYAQHQSNHALLTVLMCFTVVAIE
ncbi:hypothetical protein PFISCL1PPCAC_11138, partial [Pristionchus fissidentatus]